MAVVAKRVDEGTTPGGAAGTPMVIWGVERIGEATRGALVAAGKDVASPVKIDDDDDDDEN